MGDAEPERQAMWIEVNLVSSAERATWSIRPSGSTRRCWMMLIVRDCDLLIVILKRDFDKVRGRDDPTGWTMGFGTSGLRRDNLNTPS